MYPIFVISWFCRHTHWVSVCSRIKLCCFHCTEKMSRKSQQVQSVQRALLTLFVVKYVSTRFQRLHDVNRNGNGIYNCANVCYSSHSIGCG